VGDTKIQWSDKVWNPIRGCSRISTGCENCYAERTAARFIEPNHPRTGRPMTFAGFATRGPNGPRWTGKLALVEDKLAEPLSWRTPARVFVNSMSDLFHEKLTDEEIAAVFGVMAACPQHQFQVLTKRAERMEQWCTDASPRGMIDWCTAEARVRLVEPLPLFTTGLPWPFPNVWIGVSVENQEAADERIPHLLETPAAVRFLSVEPLLGPVDLSRWLPLRTSDGGCSRCGAPWSYCDRGIGGHDCPPGFRAQSIAWVIVGGESGPGARPCDVRWIAAVVEQCKAAGLPVFVKQLGSLVVGADGSGPYHMAGKGGDPAQWSEALRVREYPPAPTPTGG
jgi:protein gp37